MKKRLNARQVGYLVECEMGKLYNQEADNLKLQKLVYISFGYYGGATNKFLFKDRIEAWKYGPVVPNLYHNGVESIDKKNVGEKEFVSISTVVRHYGKYSSPYLVSLTHLSGSPWEILYEQDVKNIEIPKRLIVSYYRPIMLGLGFMSDSGLLDELAKT